MIKSLKSGFTLAEVLTTLMVIGVVAAMTIPTLLNSTDEQQSKVAFKKAMSVLSQGIQLLQAKEDECYISAGWTQSSDLATCMSNVLNGNIGGDDNDEITTTDGMTFKFIMPSDLAGAGLHTLSEVCGEDFATDAPGWAGAGNCGVIVDTNGLGKGAKEFAEGTAVDGAGFAAETTAKDQIQLSLSAKGVRPIYIDGEKNRGYEYMFGKGSDGEIHNPAAGGEGGAVCCERCQGGIKAHKNIGSGECGTLGAGWQTCSTTRCGAE